MQWHVGKPRHTGITIHDLQTYNEQKKKKKTIQPHKIHFYLILKNKEKKLGALPCFHWCVYLSSP